MTNKLEKENKLLSFNSIALTIYLVHILMNLLELPQIKYFYIFEILFFAFGAFTKKWRDLLIPTFIFFFIEGQGRVLSNYNPLIRNIFDIYLIIILVKSVISNKKLIDFKKTPLFVTVLILMHFSWYFIQLFNFQNVSFLAVLTGSKIYIFPILFFLMFIQEELDINKYDQKSLLRSFIFIILLQVFLVFFQMIYKEAHLLAISPNYNRIMRGIFIKDLFRPFGTSFISGGISVHLAYISAFLFILKSNNKLDVILKTITISTMILACFVMQVRTSLIQLILISISAGAIQLLASRFKLFLVPLLFGLIMLIPVAINNSHYLEEKFPDLNLGQSISRLQALSSLKDVKSNRASSSLFFETLESKLTKTPFGLGPGRTGAANSLFVKEIKADILFDMSYSWTLDNLFISLAIDFGWGMIFYSLLVISLPCFILAQSIVIFFKNKKIDLILTISSIVTCSILASNWGSIAIPYNPTSFFFWFFLSISITELNKRSKNHESRNI